MQSHTQNDSTLRSQSANPAVSQHQLRKSAFDIEVHFSAASPQKISYQPTIPLPRALVLGFVIATLGVLFYFSLGIAGTVHAEANTATRSFGTAANGEREQQLAITGTLNIPVRAALGPYLVAQSSGEPIIIPVRGSLGPPPAAVPEAERFSELPDESLREVTVVGSTDEAAHRASRESWLAYLRDLQDAMEVNESDRALRAQFEQEKAEFAKAYPSVNLAAQLSTP